MKLFRRKTFTEIHAADIEAARVAASGLGGYRFEVVDGFPYTSGHMTSPAVESAQSPGAETPAREDAPARDAGAGSARAGASNEELRESLDLANLEIEALNQINKRLRSERDQAIAQMVIARQQRDEARAIGGAEKKAP
jgi:hypothetical protein